MNISGNGKLVVAAYGDGTIRWHRLSDGQELLALFVHAKDRRFIAWTPQGYYAASPGAEDLIGWHVNRGFDTAPDFYPASTFASTYNKPAIVQAALDNWNRQGRRRRAFSIRCGSCFEGAKTPSPCPSPQRGAGTPEQFSSLDERPQPTPSLAAKRPGEGCFCRGLAKQSSGSRNNLWRRWLKIVPFA